jgi:hypothetical protein
MDQTNLEAWQTTRTTKTRMLAVADDDAGRPGLRRMQRSTRSRMQPGGGRRSAEDGKRG